MAQSIAAQEMAAYYKPYCDWDAEEVGKECEDAKSKLQSVYPNYVNQIKCSKCEEFAPYSYDMCNEQYQKLQAMLVGYHRSEAYNLFG